MKAIKGMFGIAKKMGTTRGRNKAIFDAYEQRDYEKVVEIASQMQGTTLMKDMRKDDMTILH